MIKTAFTSLDKTKKGILIRAVGGLDEDHFLDESFVRRGSKKTKIYDTPTGNVIRLGREGKDMTSNDREKNIYNKSDYHYEYDYLVSIPLIGFNPDDGFALGADLLFTKYKFKKSPFSSTHRINLGYSFATQGYDIAYEGNFVEAVGSADLLLEGVFRAPKFVENFFGFGNDTKILTEGEDFDFNRVRNSLTRFKAAVKQPIGGGGGFFSFGPFAERIQVEETMGRFVTDELSDLPDNIFDSKYYSGVEMGLNFMNLNNAANPSRGIIFATDIGLKLNLKENDKIFIPFKTELTIYESLNEKETIVFASRIGTEIALGDFEFFQAPVLGGNTNLRGFRSERFSGNGAFYHNNDLRIRLFGSDNSTLPFSFGISGGFDYGRVWLDGEESDTWHYGYGGGIWIAPIDFIVISAQMFISEEDERLVVKVGHAF